MNVLPFDRTFILTMRRSLNDPNSRFNATQEHLKSHGVVAEPFVGFDGAVTGLVTTHTYELDNPGTNFRISAKTVNLYLGHYSIWNICQYISGDSFMLFEDDARLVDGWKDRLSEAIPFPDDWDIIFLGSCCCMDKPDRQHCVGTLFSVKYALCTHAYAIRKRVVPLLLEVCERVYTGLDIALCLHAIPQLKTYAFLPRLVDQFDTVIHP